MREWEQATWSAGRTEEQVIRKVGEIVAAKALQLTDAGDRVLVLTGKGHNGDDARAALGGLSARQVELLPVTRPEASLAELSRRLDPPPQLVVDGLFGIGLNRELSDSWIQLIRVLNASCARVLAVDVPSGLNAETGEPMPEAVRAAVTLTLGAPKLGFLSPTAWSCLGRLEVAPDIGLAAQRPAGDVLFSETHDFCSYPPPRLAHAHKGDYGHLAIVAGSLGYHGAAVLAARGAMGAKPGLITVFPQEEVYGPVAGQLAAPMVRPWSGADWHSAEYSAILLGPGLAQARIRTNLKPVVAELWQTFPGPVMVDASGLDWIPAGATASSGWRAVTPHPGEAARMLGCKTAEVQTNRLASLRQISRTYGNCWVVLKGYQTMIGRLTGTVYVNGSGNPGLAQGGSGDVLAGYLAGLLAQPALARDPSFLIRFAVWQHGHAADSLARESQGWSAEDLAQAIGR